MTALRRPPSPARRGFTITELMISLALVLLLVIAMTQIFRVTSNTISKGNATGEVVRGLDAVRTSLQLDFTGNDEISYDAPRDTAGMLPTAEQPSIIIYSTSTPTYLNVADFEADSDGNVRTIDTNNDGVDEPALLSPYQTGRRWFRTDTLSFTARGEFSSQTNLQPGGAFVSGVKANEAWVWYGHGRVYDGQGTLNASASYFRPGEFPPEDNLNHFYANQFVLLRTAMLMKAPEDHDGLPGTAPTVTNSSGIPVYHARARWDQQNPETSALYFGTSVPYPNLGPFIFDNTGYDSPVSVYSPGVNSVAGTASTAPYDQDHESVSDGSTYYVNMDSRVDVAGIDSVTWRQRLRVYQDDATNTTAGAVNGPLRFNHSDPQFRNYGVPVTWYERLFARSGNITSGYRFWINPFVLRPLDAGEVSQASNYLLGGASQFIVEYAGDFLTQDATNNGAATANVPDGIIDYTIDVGGVRHIRWYGAPRDVDRDGLIPGPGSGNYRSPDVRPLADFAAAGGPITVDTGFPFEKRLPGVYSGSPESMATRSFTEYNALGTPVGFDGSYLVAWGPGDFDGDLYPNATHNYPDLANIPLRPALIRVIVESIDQDGRLEDSLPMELVFRVPAE